MKHLRSLNKYFIRYKGRLLLGILFISISNLFAVSGPVVVRNVLDSVQEGINSYHLLGDSPLSEEGKEDIFSMVFWNGLLLLGLAVMRGVFMFFMRQTIIVMSRHIEYDQKNEIFAHYLTLDTNFYKTHSTGDLMNRIAE